MDIDMSALRAVAVDKEISVDLLVDSIEQALLVAYHHTPGATANARVELNRDTGHVTVWAVEDVPEGAEDGFIPREFDDTPEGFGRVASTTARQVLIQRLREAEDDVTHGALRGQDRRPGLRSGPAGPGPAAGVRGPRQGRGGAAAAGGRSPPSSTRTAPG